MECFEESRLENASAAFSIQNDCAAFPRIAPEPLGGGTGSNLFLIGLVLNGGPALVPIGATLEFEARAKQEIFGKRLAHQ